MVLKTFNVEEEFYKKFSNYCKENGFSMSQQVNLFIKTQVEEEPKVRDSYLKKLDRIRKHGKFIEVKNFSDRYDL